MACLSKLNDWPEAEALAMIKAQPDDFEEAVRLGKLGQLLFLKGSYEQIQSVVLDTIELFAKNGSPELYRMMSTFSPLIWIARDWKAVTRLLEHTNASANIYKLLSFYNLMDLRDSLDWQQLLELQDLWELLELRKLRELWQLRELLDSRQLRRLLDLRDLLRLRQMRDLRDLREMRDLWELRQMQELQELWHLRELDARTLEVFEKNLVKIAPVLEDIISTSLHTLQGLSEEGKRKYFKYVD